MCVSCALLFVVSVVFCCRFCLFCLFAVCYVIYYSASVWTVACSAEPGEQMWCHNGRSAFCLVSRRVSASVSPVVAPDGASYRIQSIKWSARGKVGQIPDICPYIFWICTGVVIGDSVVSIVCRTDQQRTIEWSDSVSAVTWSRKKCDFCGSNTGPPDLQSDALPTELKPRVASDHGWSPNNLGVSIFS